MKDENPKLLEGKTAHYSGNGRKLGYPTANITTHTGLDDGVYFGYASIAGYSHHPSLIFIGTPTTVGDTVRRAEAHLLDIKDEDLYGRSLKIELHHFHRPNQTFESVDKLMEIMKDDEKAGRAWFKKRKD